MVDWNKDPASPRGFFILEKVMAYKLRMVAEYCNIVATLALVVIMTILLVKVLPLCDVTSSNTALIEPETNTEEIDSVAYLANLWDSDGDECRPILYHPSGREPLSFD